MASGFTQICVENAGISKYKDLCIQGLQTKITRHYRGQNSEQGSQTLWSSYSTQVIRSYSVSRRILPSPTVYRNTLIHTQINSHTVLTCTIGLHKPVLPAAEFCHIVKLNLINEIWGYGKLSSGHPVVLSIILKWRNIYFVKNKYLIS
jgi:hypothetical protein